MTTYSHDWQGQLTAVSYSGFTAPNVTWSSPDSRGRYTQRTDGAGSHTLTYNDKGQLTGDAVTTGHLAGVTTTMVPNALGQEQGLGVTVGGAPIVSHSYSYDPATGRLASASDLLRNVSATFGYTPNSNWSSAVNTSSAGIQRLQTVRTPDGLGRLAAISSTVPGQSAPVESHTYHYNAKGLRQEVNVAGGEKWVYGYNARNEVTSGVRRLDSGADVPGTSFGYNFDAIGNRTSTTVNGRTASYTQNGQSLNQYGQREVPAFIDVGGSLGSGAEFTAGLSLSGLVPVPEWREEHGFSILARFTMCLTGEIGVS